MGCCNYRRVINRWHSISEAYHWAQAKVFEIKQVAVLQSADWCMGFTCTTVWNLFILCSTARAMHTKLQHMCMSRLLCSLYHGALTASDPRLTPLTLPVSVSGPVLSPWFL